MTRGRGRSGKCQNIMQYCDCNYHRRMKVRIQQEINADTPGSAVGDRWKADDGTTHTVNPTSDPRVPGGYYHSQTNSDGEKSTAVFDADGFLAAIKQNKDWK